MIIPPSFLTGIYSAAFQIYFLQKNYRAIVQGNEKHELTTLTRQDLQQRFKVWKVILHLNWTGSIRWSHVTHRMCVRLEYLKILHSFF